MTASSQSVSKNALKTYEAIVALTDTFCREHLNEDYRELACDMAAALCRKRPSPVMSGQPRTWACGIIYALGQTNFLSDRSTEPYMTMADVCNGFAVSPSTGSAKARVISQALQVHSLDPRWCLPSLIDANPLVWMAEVNGLLVDLRHMPREVQEIAFENGMIPYDSCFQVADPWKSLKDSINQTIYLCPGTRPPKKNTRVRAVSESDVTRRNHAIIYGSSASWTARRELSVKQATLPLPLLGKRLHPSRAAIFAAPHLNSVPSLQMQCRITATCRRLPHWPSSIRSASSAGHPKPSALTTRGSGAAAHWLPRTGEFAAAGRAISRFVPSGQDRLTACAAG